MHNENPSIVIPACFEQENIRGLLERVYRSVEPADCAFDFIIMDNDSPDKTWDIASQHADRYPVRAPEKIPDLVSRVGNGADIAIGSRFAERAAGRFFMSL